jgi:hypothetical protein
MVGFFTVWRGQPADRHKPNDVVLGYSRDGWHWSRPDRRAFCPISDRQGDWNANNVQSAGGGFLVVGDELYFYVSGRTGRPGGNKAGALSKGLATLRRDGFASMDAQAAGGTLTTRPVRFSGRHLFVNVDNPSGELRVEILDQTGQVVTPFTTANCIPVQADKTLQPVRWRGGGGFVIPVQPAGAVSLPLEERLPLRLLGLAGALRRQSRLCGRGRAGLFQ